MLQSTRRRVAIARQYDVLQALTKLTLESSVLALAMRSTPSDPFEDPDLIETLPASARTAAEVATPFEPWDSEAPTVVHARRPLFAPPARLPST
jgi:hypothetical protein